MKKCPKCQADVFDEADTCPYCGEKLRYFGSYSSNELSGNDASIPVFETVKKFFTSPVALVAVITYTLYIILNIIALVVGENSSTIQDMMSEVGTSQNADYSALDGALGIFSAAALIPVVFMAIGMWMTYMSAKNSLQGESVSKNGFTMIKAGLIINFVQACVAFAFVELIFALVAAMAPDIINIAETDVPIEAVQITAVVIVAVIAAGFVFYTVYFACSLKTIKTITTTLSTGVASYKVSAFVAVILIMEGVIALLTLASGGGIWTLLASLCSAVSSILFGALLFSYRSKMNALVISSYLKI